MCVLIMSPIYLFIYMPFFVILHLKQETTVCYILFKNKKNPQISRNLDSYGLVCICFQAGEWCLPLGLLQVSATPAGESKSNKVSFLLCRFTVFVMNWHPFTLQKDMRLQKTRGLMKVVSPSKVQEKVLGLFLAHRWGIKVEKQTTLG